MGRRPDRRRFLQRGRRLLIALLAAACRDGTSSPPRVHGHRLLVPGTEEGAAVIVDLDRGRTVAAMGPRFLRQSPSVLTPSGELITAGRLENDESILVGIDARSGQETWRVTIAQGSQPALVDGVEIGTAAIARHATRPEIYLWRSEQDGQPGIAIFDYTTQRVTGFVSLPTNRVRAIAAAPPDGQHPEGCVVAAADGVVAQQTRAYLLFFCGPSFAAQDSMPLAFPTQTVTQLEITPGGQELVLGSNSELLVVDPSARQVKWRASRPLPSPFFSSVADGRYFLADAGTLTVSSSGLVYALDQTLELSAVVDLRTSLGDARPLGVLGGAASRDGRWLYLVGGVGRDGPAYGPEETRLLILELATARVHALLPLGTVGGGRPYLVP